MDALKGISQKTVSGYGIEKTKSSGEDGFGATLKSLVDQADAQMTEAGRKAEEFALGKHHDIHEVMVATEKADLSFRLLIQLRNKVVEAYQEIMRMQF